jgi:hypothetical protein
MAEDNLNNDLVKIYPNPSSTEFTIELENFSAGNEIIVEAYDLSGKQIFTQHFSNNKSIKVDVRKWSAGTYVLCVRGREGIAGRKKIIVSK